MTGSQKGFPQGRKRGEWGLGRLRGILLNVSYLTVAQVIDYIGRVGVGIILARALGPQKFGLYAYAFSLAALTVGSSYFGLAPLASRAVARTHGRQEEESNGSGEIAQIMGAKVWLTLSALTILGALLLIPSISKGENLLILTLGIYWGEISTSTVIQALFLGLGRSELAAMLVGLRWFVVAGVAFSAFVFPELMLVASGLAFAGLVELTVGALVAFHRGLLPKWEINTGSLRILRVALPFALIAVAGLIPHFLRAVIGIRGSVREVGFFAVAMSAASMACMPAQSIRSVLFAAISGEGGEFKALPAYVKASLSWGASVGALFYTLSSAIILAVFGQKFLPACCAAKVLSFFVIATYIASPLQAALTAEGREREVAFWSMGLVFVSTTLAFLRPSAEGGAIAAAIGQSLLALVFWIRKRFPLHPASKGEGLFYLITASALGVPFVWRLNPILGGALVVCQFFATLGVLKRSLKWVG